MGSRRKIVFVTGNAQKLKEISSILGTKIPFQIINQDLNVTEIQGSNNQIATEKCRSASQQVKGPVFIEDTSLQFKAYKGLPGPYIKHFLENIGAEGLYRMLEGWSDKSATASCIIAFTEGPNQEVHLFRGDVDGHIVQPRGTNGFGFDPCFLPNGYTETFGELAYEYKNSISHRFKAVVALREYLENITVA